MMEEKAVRFPNLLAEMARSGKSNSHVADVLGISQSSLSRRLSGEIEWTKFEIDVLCDHFNKKYEYLFNEHPMKEGG